ncbi:MAG: hypothetical protein JWO67_4528 [Streptosporangiaceae bacterium]|nr:hypothetical protein [Streptosporangiaceae bacterium]
MSDHAGAVPHLAGNQAKVIEQQARVYELRQEGDSIREIARKLNMSRGTVQNRLDDEWIRRIGPLSDALRERDLGRMEDAEQRLMAEKDAIEVGDKPDMIAKLTMSQAAIWDRRAKILGYNAPEKFQVSGATVVDIPPSLRAAMERAEVDAAKRESEIRARANGS